MIDRLSKLIGIFEGWIFPLTVPMVMIYWAMPTNN
ncbi:putative membrane protein [Yersinia ruckeri ATCC 29473]|uniref:Uncharacterized protein n=1 Tax=Yersinia ruckeri TaxID=29486 RepID=A0A380S9A9_YERRU|nr:putative membrane protein [Yersinia ruckeri ATCC 29473]QTD78507.1 Uncharacterized protein YR821_p20048 [Yersinia ruckeri]CNI47715.1 Uncharacterised protein [Yersinia ruckeri]SUQ37529.1 Uncharacterised protein [Yersinia ruckeri]SUQ37657.1 Uncharacterised protein [Yersinia ruckeri]